jgi:hypothetical protein
MADPYASWLGNTNTTGNFTDTRAPTTTNTSSTQQQSGTSQQFTDENVQTDAAQMDAKSLKALQDLIAQLGGGGTQAQAEDRARRQQEADIISALRSGYSKDAAFADAQGAMAQQTRGVTEKLVPSITRAAEGAGTSANSMRALLLQDAAARAGESASALGLKAATDYGNTAVNYSSILERLLQPNDQVTNDLLQALNIAKGAVSSSTTQKSGSSLGSSQSTATTQQQQTSSGGGSSRIYSGSGSSLGSTDSNMLGSTGAPSYQTTTTPTGTIDYAAGAPSYQGGSSDLAGRSLADWLTADDGGYYYSGYTF